MHLFPDYVDNVGTVLSGPAATHLVEVLWTWQNTTQMDSLVRGQLVLSSVIVCLAFPSP